MGGKAEKPERCKVGGKPENIERCRVDGRPENAERFRVGGKPENAERCRVDGRPENAERCRVGGKAENAERRIFDEAALLWQVVLKTGRKPKVLKPKILIHAICIEARLLHAQRDGWQRRARARACGSEAERERERETETETETEQQEEKKRRNRTQPFSTQAQPRKDCNEERAMTSDLTVSALLVVAQVVLEMCVQEALLKSDTWLGEAGLYAVCREVRFAPCVQCLLGRKAVQILDDRVVARRWVSGIVRPRAQHLGSSKRCREQRRRCLAGDDRHLAPARPGGTVLGGGKRKLQALDSLLRTLREEQSLGLGGYRVEVRLEGVGDCKEWLQQVCLWISHKKGLSLPSGKQKLQFRSLASGLGGTAHNNCGPSTATFNATATWHWHGRQGVSSSAADVYDIKVAYQLNLHRICYQRVGRSEKYGWYVRHERGALTGGKCKNAWQAPQLLFNFRFASAPATPASTSAPSTPASTGAPATPASTSAVPQPPPPQPPPSSRAMGERRPREVPDGINLNNEKLAIFEAFPRVVALVKFGAGAAAWWVVNSKGHKVKKCASLHLALAMAVELQVFRP
eukprot:s132_g15.t1